MMNPPPAELECPGCHHRYNTVAIIPWGDGIQRISVTAFLCRECGCVSILNLQTWKVEAIPPEGFAIIEDKNPKLHAQLRERQGEILAAIATRSMSEPTLDKKPR
jgi:hypothetical protein